MSGSLTVVGTLESITEKGDWTRFEINVGRQYPMRLDTKKEEIIAKGRAVRGHEAVWTYVESQGGENPRKPGEYFTNRHLENAEILTDSNRPAGTTSGGGSSSGGGATIGRPPEERRSIERQTILKAVIPLLPRIPEGDDEEAFLTFCDHCFEWLTEAPAAVPASTGATESDGEPGGGHEAAPPPTDDDIPFAWLDGYQHSEYGQVERTDLWRAS